MAPIIEKAVRAARFCGENPQSRCRKVGYMSCVPWETKFIPAISSVRYRNSFQCDAMPRPRLLQSLWRVRCQTSDSSTRKRTNNASNAGSPPMKNIGRQPHRGKTKK